MSKSVYQSQEVVVGEDTHGGPVSYDVNIYDNGNIQVHQYTGRSIVVFYPNAEECLHLAALFQTAARVRQHMRMATEGEVGHV